MTNKIKRIIENIDIKAINSLAKDEMIELNSSLILEMSMFRWINNISTNSKITNLISNNDVKRIGDEMKKVKLNAEDINFTLKQQIEHELILPKLKKLYGKMSDEDKNLFWKKIDYIDKKL